MKVSEAMVRTLVPFRGVTPRKSLLVSTPVAQTITGPPVVGGRPSQCQSVSFRAGSDAAQEKRRGSPPALGVGRSADVTGPKSGVHGLSCLVR